MNFPVKQTSIVSRRMNAPLGKTGTGVFIPKIDPTETSTRRKTKPTSTGMSVSKQSSPVFLVMQFVCFFLNTTTGPKREERQRQKKLSQPEKHMITGQSSSKDWTYSPWDTKSTEQDSTDDDYLYPKSWLMILNKTNHVSRTELSICSDNTRQLCFFFMPIL